MGRREKGQNMKKTSLPNRAISVVLSALMAFTLVPSAAFAAGADAAASDAENTAPTATDDTASASDTANQDAYDTSADANAAPEDAAASSVISEQHALDVSAEHGQAAAADDTPEMVRAAVSVQANGDQAGTLLSYNGLSFQVSTNAEGTPTAALVGLTATASGTLEIPAQIVSNGTTYHVTNISSNKELGGGGGGGLNFFYGAH